MSCPDLVRFGPPHRQKNASCALDYSQGGAHVNIDVGKQQATLISCIFKILFHMQKCRT